MLTSPLNSFSHTAPAPEKITDAIYTHTTRIGQYKLANIPEVRTPTTSHSPPNAPILNHHSHALRRRLTCPPWASTSLASSRWRLWTRSTTTGSS